MKSMALEGLTIADFGWVWAAPHLGRLLADMGARVIKIESQVRMDGTRSLPPFLPDQVPGLNRSGYHGWLNRNKLGVTLNLTTPRGVELAKDIIKISDGMMENYSVGSVLTLLNPDSSHTLKLLTLRTTSTLLLHPLVFLLW